MRKLLQDIERILKTSGKCDITIKKTVSGKVILEQNKSDAYEIDEKEEK